MMLFLKAHMDEVGFMVSKIEPTGFVRFLPVGPILKSLLVGPTIRIHLNICLKLL